MINPFFSKRGQSSLEFVSIFGIGLALILLLGAIFFTVANSSKDSLDQKQIDNIGNEIIENIQKIYFRGPGNKISIKTKFPERIQNFTIHTDYNNGERFNYLKIDYLTEGDVFSSIYFPDELYIYFNCTSCYYNVDNEFWWFNDSDYNAGQKTLAITSKGEYVNVDFVR